MWSVTRARINDLVHSPSCIIVVLWFSLDARWVALFEHARARISCSCIILSSLLSLSLESAVGRYYELYFVSTVNNTEALLICILNKLLTINYLMLPYLIDTVTE